MTKEVRKVEPRPFAFVEVGGYRNIRFFLAVGTEIMSFHVLPHFHENTIVHLTPARKDCNKGNLILAELLKKDTASRMEIDTFQ
ncbi:MAG: hypothetical protein WCW78_00600 [Candidatus Paceibacterota bacterium]